MMMDGSERSKKDNKCNHYWRVFSGVGKSSAILRE